MLGLLIGGLTAAAVTVAVAPAGAGPRVADVVPVTAPVVAPTTASPAPPAPTRTASPSNSGTATRSAAPTKRSRTAKPKPATRRTTSCAERAMQAGRFDPSCSEYQGYLDPGTAAGREPTSGEIQMQYACEQGLVPRSQCD
jgi:hypothetical protein